MLPLDNLYTYFYIILGGFMLVRTFRKTMEYKTELGEFEYLGLSTFWGIIVLFICGILAVKSGNTNGIGMIDGGVILSVIGLIAGWISARIWKYIKNIKHGNRS